MRLRALNPKSGCCLGRVGVEGDLLLGGHPLLLGEAQQTELLAVLVGADDLVAVDHHGQLLAEHVALGGGVGGGVGDGLGHADSVCRVAGWPGDPPRAPGRPEDLPALPAIEVAADALFAEQGRPAPAVVARRRPRRAAHVLVAGDPVVGFARLDAWTARRTSSSCRCTAAARRRRRRRPASRRRPSGPRGAGTRR